MAIIAGNTTEDCRIIVIDETTWTIEKQIANVPAGDYTVNYLTTGPKIVLAKSLETGDCKSYGQISTIGDPVPDSPYTYYVGDNIVSKTNWPDESTSGLHLINTFAWSGDAAEVRTDGPNNHKYMRINPGSTISTNTFSNIIPSAATIAIVMRQVNPSLSVMNGEYGYWIVGHRSYSPNIEYGARSGYSIRHNAGAGQAYWWMGADLSIHSSSCWPTQQWFLLIMRYDSGSLWYQGNKRGHLRRNGVDQTTTTTSVYNTQSPQYVIFGDPNKGYHPTDFAEFIYYQRVINDDELNMLETYLKNKYSIY